MLRFLSVLPALLALPAAADTVLIGSYTWQEDHPRFGGFSAIEMADDGQSFIALSDRALFVRGTVVREGEKIVDVTLDALHPLYHGNRVPLRRDTGDSEGLAIAPDGTIHVSFEWTHGIRQFAGIDQPASPLESSTAFAEMQTNSSLEALAIGPDGALYTVPERSGLATRPFPVFRFHDDAWSQPFALRRDGSYLISGADIGPDNHLYILERDFVGIGFRSRVRRFALDGTGEELILETGLRTHDNLEGISVWQDDAGLRMTMISDDNFRSFQRTEIVEYRLTD